MSAIIKVGCGSERLAQGIESAVSAVSHLLSALSHERFGRRHLQCCHPERSRVIRWRITCAVEGSLHSLQPTRRIWEFLPTLLLQPLVAFYAAVFCGGGASSACASRPLACMARLNRLRKNSDFWVEQRFSAAVRAYSSIAALAAEVMDPSFSAACEAVPAKTDCSR